MRAAPRRLQVPRHNSPPPPCRVTGARPPTPTGAKYVPAALNLISPFHSPAGRPAVVCGRMSFRFKARIGNAVEIIYWFTLDWTSFCCLDRSKRRLLDEAASACHGVGWSLANRAWSRLSLGVDQQLIAGPVQHSAIQISKELQTKFSKIPSKSDRVCLNISKLF